MTKIINLFAGPGSGKSTTACGVQSLLKLQDVNSEISTEYAKDVTWRGAQSILKDQVYVFGKQNNKIQYLTNQVDVVISDSPTLLSLVYADKNDKALHGLVLDRFNKQDNMNFFIRRKKKYQVKGRNQSKSQAVTLDDRIANMLLDNHIRFTVVDGDYNAINIIAMQVLDKLGKDPKYGVVPLGTSD